jgi:ATP-binding cassette subfamily B protein
MKPYRWIIIVGFFTVILPVTMELVVPRTLQYIIDQGIRASNLDVIIRGSLIMVGAALIGTLATLGQGVCRAWLSQGLAFDMRNELFTRVHSLSFANLDQMQTGQLMTRLASDVDVVRMFSSAGLALILRAALMIIGSVVMIVITDWQLSLIMLIVLAVAAVLIGGIIRVARPMFTVVQQKLAVLNTRVQGARVVKAFVREQFEIDRFGQSNIAYMQDNVEVGRLIAVALPLLILLTNLGSVAVIWFGGLDVIGGRLSVGELIAFNNYLMIGIAPLMMLGNMLTMAARAEASAARVLEVLDVEPLIQTGPSAHNASSINGHVVFENVSFRYNANGQDRGNGRRAVLDKVSFEVRPGQRVALLGATGSGKSTLVHLMPRFYDVTGGQVRIDGVDVRDWQPASLRRQIGLVLQLTTLFSGTIRENIAYGRPDAPLEVVIAAAKTAQAHDFITALPAGYDSPVEARGANLSGGQKQRMAIARALLISPGILILDDSTSAVDMDTEFNILQALNELMVDRTTFIIAQRITSVLNADQILILDAGCITARGTHNQLLQTSPIYQEIYYSQLGEKQPAGPRPPAFRG